MATFPPAKKAVGRAAAAGWPTWRAELADRWDAAVGTLPFSAWLIGAARQAADGFWKVSCMAGIMTQGGGLLSKASGIKS